MRILLIDGHAETGRLSSHLLDLYQSALPVGVEVVRIALSELDFDPILHGGYARRQAWEPDLERAAAAIERCDHLVLAFPMWWGGEPALLKGFLDRVFLPHFSFRYHEKGSMWDGLLEGRSADLLVTMDTPGFFLRFAYSNSIIHRMRKQIFAFCGFKPVRFHAFGPVRRGGAEKSMAAWQRTIAKLAASAGKGRKVEKLNPLQPFLTYQAASSSAVKS
jgi:NAD(P)H dehydrogenase (quinone)